MSTAVKQSLTSATTTSEVQGRQVEVSIKGTFTADWTIWRKVAGQDDAVKTGTSADSVSVFTAGSPVWVEVTSYTSGTVEVALEAH